MKPGKGERELVTTLLEGHEVLFADDLSEIDSMVLEEVTLLSVFVDTEVDATMLAQLPALTCISTRSVGFDHIAVTEAKARGIAILRVPHYGSQTVAEFAFALMFALSRNAYQAYVDMMDHASITDLTPYEGFDLAGKTLGVVGTGLIGQRVCAIAKSFGMNVLAFDQYPNETLLVSGVAYVDLEMLMRQSDLVTIHVPGRPETHHMINAHMLSLMKPTAYLINTARGEVVDTQALVDALQNKQIAGAGLDVLEEELALKEESILTDAQKQDTALMHALELNHTLISMPNVVVTPHIAFDTKEAKREIIETTVENIKSYSRGEVVNEIPS